MFIVFISFKNINLFATRLDLRNNGINRNYVTVRLTTAICSSSLFLHSVVKYGNSNIQLPLSSLQLLFEVFP